MPISAVSRSRISPTMITSGSCLKNERSAEAKVMPCLTFCCTWLMPSTRISTGSSTVEMLRPSSFRMCRAVYSVTVLPLPVGPVARIMP